MEILKYTCGMVFSFIAVAQIILLPVQISVGQSFFSGAILWHVGILMVCGLLAVRCLMPTKVPRTKEKKS